jgi:hypothetical protein
VRGRLRRAPNPKLAPDEHDWFIACLKEAQRDVARAKKRSSPNVLAEVRARIDAIERALGLRGPPWWDDGAPDLTRHLARNTPYADWFASVQETERVAALETNDA